MNPRIKTITIVVIIVIIALAVFKNYSKSDVGLLVPSPQDQIVTSAQYYCYGGKIITAEYHRDGGASSSKGFMNLSLSDGSKKTLMQTVSADGSRYANADESFVFWSKGNGVLVLENNVQKTYVNCIRAVDKPEGSDLSQVYVNHEQRFSLRLPAITMSSVNESSGFKVDEAYKYGLLGPGRDIFGTKFSIPSSMATGTNLGNDSYISVEEMQHASSCMASLFVANVTGSSTVTDQETTYSVVSSDDAALGNRYEETVYAIPGTNPCIAVRYFIHYARIENYPVGAVKEFDRKALINEFDQIRRTLLVNSSNSSSI